MAEADWIPVGDVVGSSIRIPPLDSGLEPVSCMVFVKCVDPTGKTSWQFRISDHISHAEAIGAFAIYDELAQQEATDSFKS